MSDRFLNDTELKDCIEAQTSMSIATKSGVLIKYVYICTYSDKVLLAISLVDYKSYTIPWRNIDYIIEESE